MHSAPNTRKVKSKLLGGYGVDMWIGSSPYYSIRDADTEAPGLQPGTTPYQFLGKAYLVREHLTQPSVESIV